MTHQISKNYYPLTDLIAQVREDAPGGQTFALKRVSHPREIPHPRGTHKMELTAVNGPPEAYILDTSKLASRLKVAHFSIRVAQLDEIEIQRRVTRSLKPNQGEDESAVEESWQVAAVQFAGEIDLPALVGAPAIGAYVPGETSTGFLHILDKKDAAALAPAFGNHHWMQHALKLWDWHS